MEHVYLLTNTFLDLIQRDNVLPKGINTTMIISAVGQGPEAFLQFFKLHWQDFLLQYIGVLTTGVFGLLLALILPLIGMSNEVVIVMGVIKSILRFIFLLLSLCGEMRCLP